MKWLKICVLLVATLAVMRAGSWAVAYGVVRLTVARVRCVAVVANLVAFTAFVCVLKLNMLPGEPFDWAATLFGFAVFAIFTATDFFWRPWEPGVRTRGGG